MGVLFLRKVLYLGFFNWDILDLPDVTHHRWSRREKIEKLGEHVPCGEHIIGHLIESFGWESPGPGVCCWSFAGEEGAILFWWYPGETVVIIHNIRNQRHRLQNIHPLMVKNGAITSDSVTERSYNLVKRPILYAQLLFIVGFCDYFQTDHLSGWLKRNDPFFSGKSFGYLARLFVKEVEVDKYVSRYLSTSTSISMFMSSKAWFVCMCAEYIIWLETVRILRLIVRVAHHIFRLYSLLKLLTCALPSS